MPTPDYILELREKVGHTSLWLTGVTAVVLRGSGNDQDVLLVRRSDNGHWTPVTGITEPGEEPAVTAERETLEEACVVARAERLVWVHVLDPIQYDNGDRCRFLDLVFRCRYVSGEAAVGDDESVDARWFPLNALPDLAQSYRDSIRLAVTDAPGAVFER